MDLIKFSLKNPITIIVGVLLVVLFGIISLNKLPYQLTPNVAKPEIKITTTWAGATPYEIEREVISEQEDALKSLNNLVEYESTSSDNSGEIKLTFKLGTDIRVALQDVSNKLNEVSSYPDNVDEPIIETATASPVIWIMLQTLDDNKRHVDEYKTYFEDEIKEGKMSDYQDHYYPSEMAVDAQIQTFLMKKDSKAFLKKFDTDWVRYNRDIIRKVEDYEKSHND